MLPPPNPLKKFNCYSKSFSVRHELSCRHVELVIAHHNEVQDNLVYLEHRAFSPQCVHDEPLIQQGHIISEYKIYQGRGELETRGDLLIRGLWEIQAEAIIGFRMGGKYFDSYKKDPMGTLLYF